MLTAMMSGWQRAFFGHGRVAPPDPGNTANAPGPAPVQEGDYGYIQPAMFANQDIVSVPDIPPAFQDWAQYPVNIGDVSALTGGGESNNASQQIPTSPVLYFDQSTGMYIDLTAR